MDVSEWQKRLQDNFSSNCLIGGNSLWEVLIQESEHAEFYSNKYHGQIVLIDAFQGFYVDTVHAVYNWVTKNGWPKDCPNYAIILTFYIVNFRSFRACENLLFKGYPLDGYALMRNLKDRAIYLGAIAKNITTFPKIYGCDDLSLISVEKRRELKNAVKSEEFRTLNRMIRKECRLPEEVVKELTHWEQLFHEEVHSSKFSLMGEIGDWSRGGPIPSLGPRPRIASLAMYMNRATEIGWMLLRLLPYLQPAKDAFGDEWKRKHKILDESFRFAEQGLGDIGKKIAGAFIHFIDHKMNFPEDFHYFEADGTA